MKQSNNITIPEPRYFESLYPADTLKDELSKVVSFITKGASCQVLGLPGVGKSRLLRLLAYNRSVRELHLGTDQAKSHFIYMDFSEIKGRPLTDATKFILISLIYSLSERGMIEESNQINSSLKEALEFNDELILFQALKKSIDYLTLEKEIRIVFLIDRLESYSQDITEQFFNNLKVLRNRAKYQFACIFALTRPLDMTVDRNVLAEFYEHVVGNTVFIQLAGPDEKDFRLDYIEKVTNKKDSDTRKEILILTGGHGKLAKISYEAVLSESKTPENLSEFLLGHRQVRGALSELWKYFTPQEQATLKNTSRAEDETVQFLTHIGILNDGKISIPLFTTFIASIKEEKEVFSFDEDRNEIYKGTINLTDVLTPSEFRLLKHLIINVGRICGKEEIITAVWRDTATFEGVTDQALDQIVYRLRKKVETDPNSPQYIQTIKGKGVKLSE